MSRGKPYFSGYTKTQLTEAIRAELKPIRIGQEFESVLISGLIAEKHYYCSKKGIRPTRFRKSFRPPPAAYDFERFFPGHGWHKVSWTQCINPRDEDDWLKRALRDSIQPIVSRYKSLHPSCELCSLASEHVDHVDPEFDILANEAIAKLSEQQIEIEFSKFDWWSVEPFSLSPSSPAILQIISAHKSAVLRAVCKSCHVKSARDRRT
jgi:hypothetical protein